MRTVTPIAESFAIALAGAAGVPIDEEVRAIGHRAAQLAVVPWSSALRSAQHAADVPTLAGAALDQITQLVSAQLLAMTPQLQEA